MSKNAWKHETYNGWSNWYTWNIAMWFQNDYNVSLWIQEYVEDRQSEGKSLNYDGLLEYMGVEKGTETPDGVALWSQYVSRPEMRQMLAEYSW